MQDTDDVELDLEPDDEPQPELQSSATPDGDIDPATQAFARLERQMALMRRAVEHLATEPTDTIIPDYSATLGKIAGDLAKITQAVTQIAAEPALKHTPQTMAERISQAADMARRSDHERLLQAQSDLRTAGEELRRIVGTIRTAADQRQRTVKASGIGVLIGALLWAGLAGPIARSLPASWQLPERMARRSLGEATSVDAGIRLIRTVNPRAWEEIAQALNFLEKNREAINSCRNSARSSKKLVNCTIRINNAS